MFFTLLIAIPLFLYILIPLKPRARYLVAAALIGGMFFLFWPSMHQTYRLEKEGRHTAGIVLEKSCETKRTQTVTYKFQVGDTEYGGRGAPGAGNARCENFGIGDQVSITYLGSDPNINRPDRSVDSDIVLGTIFLLGLFPLLVWGNAAQMRFVQEKRRKRAQNT